MKHETRKRAEPRKDVISYGESSWGGGKKSVKYGWYDKRGRITRGGEVPIEALPQMLEVAIREGGLKVALRDPLGCRRFLRVEPKHPRCARTRHGR
jgi:hypothetical protein